MTTEVLETLKRIEQILLRLESKSDVARTEKPK